ncbi:class I SAM-dependent methyltransferase [Porphyromonadaceae bacterium OttesenSCG-928-L07]|nr:class I SAM-dependent methyltransferase [Porphyromonadaceae bacterium OttesenSCG-928-L07]MDL2251782.1 class I SAM-dependent methyltransferase [Odoribacter sp. OttesenSCG-928-J03]MDL2330873.1 class I SAM-dependent methyltransferase [Odoribacter sp. OttesenSCG-928-A06]
MDLKERHNIEELQRHPWEISRVKVVKKLLGKNLINGAHILDIGCGDLFLEECFLAENKSLHFYCVDTAYSPEEVEELNQKYTNVSVYNSLHDFEKEEVKIDLLLLMDVVEHIEDDKGFLEHLKAQAYITPDTRILVTVPAFQSLFSSHDHFLGHYRRYNAARMKKLVNESGLSIHKYGYFYFMLLLPRAIQLLKERMSGVKEETTGLVEWKGSAFVTKGLVNVLVADYKIGNFFNKLGIRFPGLSLYVLCQKKRV